MIVRRQAAGRGEPRLVGSPLWVACRVAVGSIAVVGGICWALLNLPAVTTTVTGLVFVGAGLVLLAPLRKRLPRGLTGAAMVVGAAAGTAGGTLVQNTSTGGMFVYLMMRGWPFPWLARGGTADDPDIARRVALASDWSVDLVRLAADLVFWGFAAMLLALVGTLAGRLRAK